MLSPHHLLVRLLCQSKDVRIHVPHLAAAVGVNHLFLIDGQRLVGVDSDEDDTWRKRAVQRAGAGGAPVPGSCGEGARDGEKEGAHGAHHSRCRWPWPPRSAGGASVARPARAGSSGPPGHRHLRGSRGCREAAAGAQRGRPVPAGMEMEQDKCQVGSASPTKAGGSVGSSTAGGMPSAGHAWAVSHQESQPSQHAELSRRPFGKSGRSRQ